MILIPGPSSRGLGLKVAELVGSRVVPIDFKIFPDGESYIRLNGDVKGSEVVLVQTTSPPQDSNLMRLLLMAEAAKELGATRLVAVVPYLAYARQDKRFIEGEAVSIETVIRLIETSGVDRLYTVNVHSEDVIGRFSIPAFNVSAMPLLAEHLREMGLGGAVAIAPDRGAVDLVKEAAEVLKGGYGWMEKRRDRITGEIEMEERALEVKDRDAVVFDDIISTGGTMAAAVRILKERGAKRVYAACAHPLMLGDSETRIMGNGAEGILGTDTVPGRFSKVSVAPAIAKAISP